MPTTAAVSATGSHVCAVLRSISVIISPTHRPIARRRSQPCETRCLHAAGRRREASSPEKQYMRLCARPERKTAVLQGLNRRMIPVWLSGYLWIATRFGSGNGAPERTFCFSCASSSPRGRACWRKWKRPGDLHRVASFRFKDEDSGNHLPWHTINPRAVNSVSAAPARRFLGGSAGTTKEALPHPSPSPEDRASNLP
jgi:hypothetical protein